MDKRHGILLVSVTILVLCFVGTASATNLSVDGSGGADFTGIQDAINKASVGDTILVHSGVYYENVYVKKSVTLKGIGYPVVDANGSGSAITLTADGITLEGFNVTNSGSSISDAGIEVTSNNNIITGNNANNNNGDGICLQCSSNNNTITGNNASSNSRDGISLDDSSNNNTITGNNANRNHLGIHLDDSSNNNTITGNNANNNKWDGISLDDSSNNNTITGNNASNNNDGIRLYSSSNNTITSNNVSNNNDDGIRLYSSSNNKIYFNNFINNTDNVDSHKPTNIWNSPEEITYTYDGNAYTSYIGNYWDDYEGTDAEGDGIGNTHYSIDSEEDESDDYPLMQPFENYNITTSHE